MLDITQDPIELTAALVDIPSVSKNEEHIANEVEEALRKLADSTGDQSTIDVVRFGNTVVARTHRGLPTRVILAGHLDTVPTAENVPHTRTNDESGQDTIFGCGSVDMKSGDAVFLNAFASLATDESLTRDMTIIMYECEEIASSENGLRKLAEAHPELVEGDVAILGEPSGALIEAGCQGSIRVKVTAHGERAHSARSWLGSNAMHSLAPVISRIANHDGDRIVDIDGCHYREGINIVMCESGVATNTIPDEAWMFVNFRFAPNRTTDQALAHLWSVIGVGEPESPEEGFSLEIDDISPGALPGLTAPAAAELIEATGGRVRAKYGWTDVARFAELGIPAVNFGPGDPSYCHKKDEQCPVHMISDVSAEICAYLTS